MTGKAGLGAGVKAGRGRARHGGARPGAVRYGRQKQKGVCKWQKCTDFKDLTELAKVFSAIDDVQMRFKEMRKAE